MFGCDVSERLVESWRENFDRLTTGHGLRAQLGLYFPVGEERPDVGADASTFGHKVGGGAVDEAAGNSAGGGLDRGHVDAVGRADV